ncbi:MULTISPECIES: hypothetical protein [Exiguobacterium]|uniref:hypothetical protein n=1 Tax=Exiguobacterium TaxID=33986 RepID=UPI000B302A88|nr:MULTISPECIES: hypothetical protein [Exiguobacterium]
MTIKEAFSNGQCSNKLLAFTYGMKFVTAFLTILMLSSSITVIAEGVTIYLNYAIHLLLLKRSESGR